MRWRKREDTAATLACLVGMFAICGGMAQQPPRSASAAKTGAVSPSLAPAPKPSPQEFVVIIDPAHGGDDKGAVFGPRFLEKDVTLSLARALRKELEQRGIATRMLRESDVTLSLQHRAEIGNQQRSSVYIALHAGVPGKGVHVYAPLLPAREQPLGRFVPWDSAQAGSIDRSAALAKAVTRELEKKELKTLNLAAFLRPLNNVLAPAIGVELAADRADVRSLESQKLQSAVASAIASGIVQLRSHPGGRP